MWRNVFQLIPKKSADKIAIESQKSIPKQIPKQLPQKIVSNEVKIYNVNDNASHKIYNFKKVPKYNDVPLL